MRIGIDANLLLGVRRGGAQYAYNLIKNLLKLDKENTYVLYYNFMREREKRKKIISEFNFPHVENRVFHIPSKILNLFWNTFQFPSLDFILKKIDVFHSPFGVETLPLKKCKWIVTIHQVTPEKYRIFEHDRQGIEKISNMLKEAPKKAFLVITDSTFTKDNLIEEYQFQKEKIRVIPLAAGNIFHPVEDNSFLKQKLNSLGIREKFILYTGGASWNKNLPRLLEAFSSVKRHLKIPHKLVLVGQKSWGHDAILPKIHQMGLENEIIFTGYISDEDVVYLYNGAEFFIYPSLLEGFGISAVEAMACGCPLAASNIPVFREVVQKAGIFFNPEDVEDIAQAMTTLIEDSGLRQEYSAKGLQRSKFFSWERTARETLNVYKEAGER